MNQEPAVKRRYQSPLRRAQAQSTRVTIVEAAARLFVAQGYVGTSMDDIAAAAGVSRATVFASVGGKAAILKTAYDIAIVGDDEPIPLPQRPWAIAVRDEPDSMRMIEAYAEMITNISGRVAPIYEAMRGAAGADPEVRLVWDAMRKERRGGAAGFVGFVVAREALRAHIDRKRAGDVVWALNDPGLFYLLVHEMAWTPAQFRSWLAETLKAQLLQV
ncbi:MAG: TetR/AcrR family transcriptional regulator [Acidimicrobiales bacterium]